MDQAHMPGAYHIVTQEEGPVACKIVVAFARRCGCPGFDSWFFWDEPPLTSNQWPMYSFFVSSLSMMFARSAGTGVEWQIIKGYLHRSLSSQSVKLKSLIFCALLGNRACVSCYCVWQIATYVVQQLLNHNLYSLPAEIFNGYERDLTLSRLIKKLCVGRMNCASSPSALEAR